LTGAGEGRDFADFGAGFFRAGLAAGFFGGDFLGEGFAGFFFVGGFFAAGFTGLPTSFFFGAGAGFLVFLAMVMVG